MGHSPPRQGESRVCKPCCGPDPGQIWLERVREAWSEAWSFAADRQRESNSGPRIQSTEITRAPAPPPPSQQSQAAGVSRRICSEGLRVPHPSSCHGGVGPRLLPAAENRALGVSVFPGCV